MKATASAPANIAFIKYWGKTDEDLRLPLNDSFSMNLDNTYTITTVEFAKKYRKDSIKLLDGIFSTDEIERTAKALRRMKEHVGISLNARVVTRNTFPKGTGAAASASGFAALTVAAFAAMNVRISERELTIFARMGSGSACRSIPDGYVWWKKGATSETSYAYSFYPHTYWDLRDMLVIVESGMKKVSTTEGQKGVKTSPLWQKRVQEIPGRMRRLQQYFAEKNFSELGNLIEEDCLDMHHVMQTQMPPLYYWNDKTEEIMEAVRRWRTEGLSVYFTIDAGPNVHVICEGKNEEKVVAKLKSFEGIERIIRNKPSTGTRLTEKHL